MPINLLGKDFQQNEIVNEFFFINWIDKYNCLVFNGTLINHQSRIGNRKGGYVKKGKFLIENHLSFYVIVFFIKKFLVLNIL